MTCGLWRAPEHNDHLCTTCTQLFGKDCKGCEKDVSCGYLPVSPEKIKERDELFRRLVKA